MSGQGLSFCEHRVNTPAQDQEEEQVPDHERDQQPLAPEWLVDYLRYLRFEKILAPASIVVQEKEGRRLALLCDQAQIDITSVTPQNIRQWIVLLHQPRAAEATSSKSGSRKNSPSPKRLKNPATDQQGAAVRVDAHLLMPLSARSLALVLSCWRGIFSWLQRKRGLKNNPIVGIHAPKLAKLLPRALSLDVAVGLLATPNQATQDGGGTANMFTQAQSMLCAELLYGCGLRVSELVQLDCQAQRQMQAKTQTRRGWLDMAGAEVHVWGKGDKYRMVPIGARTLSAVADFLQQRQQWLDQHPKAGQTLVNSGDGHALLFTAAGKRVTRRTVWSLLHALGKRAGLDAALHPHMLRHSFASHVLQSSGDLRAVQELLGHESIASTQIYTRLDFQHIAKIYDSAHPRDKWVEASANTSKPPASPPVSPPASK